MSIARLYRFTIDQVSRMLPRLAQVRSFDPEALEEAFEEGRTAVLQKQPFTEPRSRTRLRTVRPRKRKKAAAKSVVELNEELPEEERDEEQVLQEIIGCKSLLLEIIRRAAYDWVLYRTSRKLNNRVLAESAYNWLFKEEPGSPEWLERQRDGKQVTSFFMVCELLDIDPHAVRRRIKKLTPKSVMGAGRPSDARRGDAFPSALPERNLSVPEPLEHEIADDLLFDG